MGALWVQAGAVGGTAQQRGVAAQHGLPPAAGGGAVDYDAAHHALGIAAAAEPHFVTHQGGSVVAAGSERGRLACVQAGRQAAGGRAGRQAEVGGLEPVPFKAAAGVLAAA